MIATLLITGIVEAAVIIPYAAWQKKPVRQALVYTSLIGNLATQSMLWIVLTFAFRAILLIMLSACKMAKYQ